VKNQENLGFFRGAAYLRPMFKKSATDTPSWFKEGSFGLQGRQFWTSMEAVLDFNGACFETQRRLLCISKQAALNLKEASVRPKRGFLQKQPNKTMTEALLLNNE